MNDPRLARELIAALEDRQRSSGGADLRPVLEAIVAKATAAWPGVHLDRRRFVLHLGERLGSPPSDGGAMAAWLERRAAGLALGDLYLACACLAGVTSALEVFEQRYIATIRAPMRRLKQSEAAIDEVQQLLREKLLVGGGKGSPALENYGGRGDLKSWVRVVAVRTALRLRRRARREIPVEDLNLLRAPHGSDPEVELIRETYRREFKLSFQDALASLSAHERNLLRHRYLDDLNIDQIGDLYQIHRATAARRLARARERLLSETKKRLADRIAASDSTIESILRLVRTQLDLSIRRHIGEKDE